MSLQIFIADDWPGAPAAETPTEVAEVPNDPRTLLYLVDQHLAAVAEAQARAEAEARRQAELEQRAVAEAVLQAMVEQAREQAEQEARAQALAEMAAEQELAQLVFALAQEEAVLDALGRRALLLKALPAEPVYDSMFPFVLHPDSYGPDVDLDAADTYGAAISALARQARQAQRTLQRDPDRAYDEYDELPSRGQPAGKPTSFADPDAEFARYAQQAAQAKRAQAQAQAEENPGYDEYGVPVTHSMQPDSDDASLCQAWPGLLSFLQQRAEAEADAPPPAPETLASGSSSTRVPGLQYLSFPRGDAFYAPLQSAAATRNAHQSLFLAPSSSSSSQGDDEDEEDIEMEQPGVWQLLADQPTRQAPTFLAPPRARLPRHFVRHDSPSPAVKSPDEEDEEEAGLNWLAQEILRARQQAGNNKAGVVVLDDGTVGDHKYDAPATHREKPKDGLFLFERSEPVSGEPDQPSQSPAAPTEPQGGFLFERTEPVSDQPSQPPASAESKTETRAGAGPAAPAAPEETWFAMDVANEFGAGLPVQTPVAVEEPAATPKPALRSVPSHTRTSSRARATTVMDEEEEDELEGRRVQARKLQRV